MAILGEVTIEKDLVSRVLITCLHDQDKKNEVCFRAFVHELHQTLVQSREELVSHLKPI